MSKWHKPPCSRTKSETYEAIRCCRVATSWRFQPNLVEQHSALPNEWVNPRPSAAAQH